MSFQSNLRQLQSLWGQPMVPFVTVYALTGVLALLVPAIQHRRSVKAYQSSYYYQYEQQNQSYDAGRDWTDINNCKWYQFRCQRVWVNGNGEYQDNGNDNNNNNNNQGENGQYYNIPSWFSGWSQNNNSRDGASGDTEANSATLKFVYAWQTILFLGILGYSSFMLYKTKGQKWTLQTLLGVLFLWTNACFMALLLLVNGSIYSDGREIEELGGFYNQFSVMMFLTNFWYLLWSLGACAALGWKLYKASHNNNTIEGAEKANSMNYWPTTDTGAVV